MKLVSRMTFSFKIQNQMYEHERKGKIWQNKKEITGFSGNPFHRVFKLQKLQNTFMLTKLRTLKNTKNPLKVFLRMY